MNKSPKILPDLLIIQMPDKTSLANRAYGETRENSVLETWVLFFDGKILEYGCVLVIHLHAVAFSAVFHLPPPE